MLLAVVKCYGKIHDRVARHWSTSEKLVNPFVHRGDVLARDDTAHDRIDEFISFTALSGLQLDRHFTKLTSATRLLLVTITCIGRTFDRFPEWDLRLNDLDLDLVALFEALHDNVQMELALPFDEHLMQLRVLPHDERRIFFMQCVQTHRDLLFVALILGTYSTCDHGRWKLDRLQHDQIGRAHV